MAQNNNNTEMLEAIHTLAEQVDTRFTEMREYADGRFDDMEKRVDNKIGRLRSDLIDYVGRVVGEAKGDIIAAIKTDRECNKLIHLEADSIA